VVKKNYLPAWVWKRPDSMLACGLGTGAARYAPGTWGTLPGVVLYYFMLGLSLYEYLALTILLFVFGVWICGRTADALGVHDHSGIVWDEIVGYLVTMIMAPEGWIWWLLGFGLFRLFDIWKPWPIRVLDKKVSGGFGIMIDDVLAGVYAAICLHLIFKLNIF